jgi:hypothetical protein
MIIAEIRRDTPDFGDDDKRRLSMDHDAKVVIFPKVSSDFLIDAIHIGAGEPYGDAIQYSGHYDYHEALIPKTLAEYRFKFHDYDFYHRTQVVSFQVSDAFTLYADPCLTQEDTQRHILPFNMDGQKVNSAADEHYRCAKCDKSTWSDNS